MIGRRTAPPEEPKVIDEPRGFDAFDLRLGDIMRGERATLGKSLLDVQHELKIKASYIAAIENSDPSAFETPGFVAGYVRSYARYLGLDPEWAFAKFCEEGNFVVAHGLSAAASGHKPAKIDSSRIVGRDPFEQPNAPFVPRVESIFSRIEPGALGSMLVLIALICFIGYGGWSVLQEVQKVQLAPVDQTPGVTAQIGPLGPSSELLASTTNTTSLSAPNAEKLNRIVAPTPLEVPVLTERDGPIGLLSPDSNAVIVQNTDTSPDRGVPTAPVDPTRAAIAEALGVEDPAVPSVQVTEQGIPEVVMFASRPSWVRVTSVDGTVLYQKVLDANEGWALPRTEVPPLLRSGNAGAIYFVVDGEVYGPAGQGPSIVAEVALGADDLRASYGVTNDITDIDVDAIIQQAIIRRQGAN